MNETVTETTPAVETPAAAPAAAPKAKAKAKKKPAAKKASKPAGSTASATAPAKKSELRGPQVRVLRVLAKNPNGLTRAQIADKAEVDQSSLSGYVGSYDPVKRATDDAARFKSLISFGYVKIAQHDINGKDVVLHMITASGNKVLERLSK